MSSQTAKMELNVQLPHFEGPLALLLYLIRKEEMDIMDIQIHKITEQYLEYIRMMRELDLEVAGDFIAMAATLIQIKSRMLLPQYDENGEIVENEDPRKELVQRLLEYQKYQEAAKALYERPLIGRDVWLRGIRESLEQKEEEIVVEDNPLFALITAYRSALRAANRKIHQVGNKLQSIKSRVLEIAQRLLVGHKVALSELITVTEGRHRQILITFLSVLELGKAGFVSLFQTDTYQEIYIEAKKPVTAEAISNVEEYTYVQQTTTPLSPVPLLTEDILNPAETETVAEAEPEAVAADEFVLKDEVVVEDFAEMATDEEIAQAEFELAQAEKPNESEPTGDLNA